MHASHKQQSKYAKKHLPLSTYLFLFFAVSILGWVWEVILYLVWQGTFTNRGFLHGPWLPVYGTGALLLFLLLHHHRENPFLVFFLSALSCSIVECGIGFILDYFYDVRYWDYRTYFMNLNGYICLLSVLLFGLGGFFFVCIFAQKLADLWNLLPKICQKWILIVISILFVFDFIFSCFVPNEGAGISDAALSFLS